MCVSLESMFDMACSLSSVEKLEKLITAQNLVKSKLIVDSSINVEDPYPKSWPRRRPKDKLRKKRWIY